MALGKLPVPGRPTIWMIVGQGPAALAVGADGGCLDIFTLIYTFSPLSPSLWETARYRLKYCLKGPLNPKQPTNQHPFALFVGKVKGINRRVGCALFCDFVSTKWSAFILILIETILKGKNLQPLEANSFL